MTNATVTTWATMTSAHAQINQSDSEETVAEVDYKNCSHDEPYTYEYYAAANWPGLLLTVLVIMTLLTAATCVIFWDIFQFMQRFIPYPKRRTRVVWVVGTFPVISFVSLIALYVPRAFFFCLVYASLYLSVALYQFMLLVLDYYGGRMAFMEIHEGKKFHLAIPPYLCCCRCLPWITMSETNLVWIKRGVLQVALMRPLELFLSSILWADGRYSNGDVSARGGIYTILNLMTLVSTLIAIFFLNMLYRMSKDVLKEYSITPKFMIMQITLLLTNIQHLVLSFVVAVGIISCQQPLSTYTRANMLYCLLIIVEMFVIMFLARILYRRRTGNVHRLLDVTKESTKPLLPLNGTGVSSGNGDVGEESMNRQAGAPLPTVVVFDEIDGDQSRNSRASVVSLPGSRAQSTDNNTPLTSTWLVDDFDRDVEKISLSEGPFMGASTVDGRSSISSLESQDNVKKRRSNVVETEQGMKSESNDKRKYIQYESSA